MVNRRWRLWLLLVFVHTSTQHIPLLDAPKIRTSVPFLPVSTPPNLQLRGGGVEGQQASTLSEAGWTRVSGTPTHEDSVRNGVFGGGWFVEEGISGVLRDATFVLKTERNLAALEQRGRILLVAGGPWEFERCELWAEWAGIALCVSSSSVVFNSSSLGGTASQPASRCGDIITAWENASCVLAHSVLQRSTGFGGQWHENARGALYGCVISECETGVGVADSAKVRVEATLLRENLFGNFAASDNAQDALLEVRGCTLGPSVMTSAPASSPPSPPPSRREESVPTAQWASEDRPGEVLGERNHVEEEETEWREVRGAWVPKEYAALVELRDKAMAAFELRATELLPQMEATLAELKEAYKKRAAMPVPAGGPQLETNLNRVGLDAAGAATGSATREGGSVEQVFRPQIPLDVSWFDSGSNLNAPLRSASDGPAWPGPSGPGLHTT